MQETQREQKNIIGIKFNNFNQNHPYSIILDFTLGAKIKTAIIFGIHIIAMEISIILITMSTVNKAEIIIVNTYM